MCVLRSVCILLANRIDELLHLTLRPEEMEHVVAYLKTVNKPLSHDLLVLHYLQQSRLAEASQLESMFTSSMVSGLFFWNLYIMTCALTLLVGHQAYKK